MCEIQPVAKIVRRRDHGRHLWDQCGGQGRRIHCSRGEGGRLSVSLRSACSVHGGGSWLPLVYVDFFVALDDGCSFTYSEIRPWLVPGPRLPEACRTVDVADLMSHRICPRRYLAEQSLFAVIASVLSVFPMAPALDESGTPIPVKMAMTPAMTT